jgi:hypothetical protein
VRQPILRDRILERARDVGLSHQIVERLWPIFSGENLVTHKISLNALLRARKQNPKISSILIERWTLDVQRWTFSS